MKKYILIILTGAIMVACDNSGTKALGCDCIGGIIVKDIIIPKIDVYAYEIAINGEVIYASIEPIDAKYKVGDTIHEKVTPCYLKH